MIRKSVRSDQARRSPRSTTSCFHHSPLSKSSTSKTWQSTFLSAVFCGYILLTNLTILTSQEDSVFKVDATGGLRPRPCVVTDSLPERVGWVKICCVGQPTMIHTLILLQAFFSNK